MRLMTSCLCVMLPFALAVSAQDDPYSVGGSLETYTADELKQHFENVARGYVITPDSTDRPLKLREPPLMQTLNAERQTDQAGALYLWETEGGSPAVLGMIFTFRYNGRLHCRHEMLSLHKGPLTAEYQSRQVWTPREPGLSFTDLPEVTAPASTAARRLTQMRSIARQFEGTLHITEKQPARLSLLPQPLHRYQAPESGVLDGGLFSLAVGTDFEILLAIEAVKGERGELSWLYAPARGHYHELRLEREGQQVWTAPRVIELERTGPAVLPWCNQPYYILTPEQPLPPPAELR